MAGRRMHAVATPGFGERASSPAKRLKSRRSRGGVHAVARRGMTLLSVLRRFVPKAHLYNVLTLIGIDRDFCILIFKFPFLL